MAKQVIQKKGGCLPDEQQLRLLKAALFTPEIALTYWKDWLMQEGYSTDMLYTGNFLSEFFDPMDMGSERLIPLVQKNLSATGDPFITALLGNRRKVWVQNQYHLAKAKKVIELFAANRVPIFFPKGLPISIAYYNDVSVRVSGDLDLLVTKEDFAKATALLQAPPFSMQVFKKDLLYSSTRNAMPFYDSNSRQLDLHASIFQEHGNNPWLNSWALENSESFLIDGLEAKTLHVNKLLYLSILHGRDYNIVPPVRWVADAYIIYAKRSHDVDWQQLAEWSVKLKHTYFMKQALGILKDHFIPEIPGEVICYLNNQPVSWEERTYYSIIQSNKNRTRFVWKKILKLYTQFKLFNTGHTHEFFISFLAKRAYKYCRYHLTPSKIIQ